MSTVVLRPRVVTLTVAALVVAVCALPSTPLVLPVVVGGAGWSAARWVVGPRADDAVGGTDDALLRAALPVVLGMLALLGSVLLAAALGWRIDTPAITVAAGVVALGLLGAARARPARRRR